MADEKVSFFDEETGLAKEMFVLAETVLGGVSYLLVTEEEEGDSDALILKRVSGAEEEPAGEDGEEETVLYVSVTDENEMKEAINAFSDILDDVEFDEL